MLPRSAIECFAPVPPSAAAQHFSRMRGGLVGSTALHLLVLVLVIFGLPWLVQAPPVAPMLSVRVDLVRLGRKTASPNVADKAALPQSQAREKAEMRPATAVPEAQTPAPARRVAAVPDVPSPATGPRADAHPAPRLQAAPDSLDARLKKLAQLRQPTAPLPPDPRRQQGSGISSATASSANAVSGRDATYGIADFIRAQVERRWNLDRRTIKVGDWVVAIHIGLDPDGSVTRADIVDAPRYRSDSQYQEFALSARNAVLLSSPLKIPPGSYDLARDIVVVFDPRQVLQ